MVKYAIGLRHTIKHLYAADKIKEQGDDLMNLLTGLCLCICTTALLSTGCGILDKEADAPVIKHAKLSVSASEGSEPVDFELTQATCTSDVDTGFFSGSFTGSDGAALTIKIKGFSTSGASYACSQASDNAEDGVGNKYDGCTVELSIPDVETSVNTYAMHRDVESTKAFTYAEDCALTITYEEPRVLGTVNCAGLVQTQLQGSPRNPIDESVTATINDGSTFFCDL